MGDEFDDGFRALVGSIPFAPTAHSFTWTLCVCVKLSFEDPEVATAAFGQGEVLCSKWCWQAAGTPS
jgi:hypothetical protein